MWLNNLRRNKLHSFKVTVPCNEVEMHHYISNKENNRMLDAKVKPQNCVHTPLKAHFCWTTIYPPFLVWLQFLLFFAYLKRRKQLATFVTFAQQERDDKWEKKMVNAKEILWYMFWGIVIHVFISEHNLCQQVMACSWLLESKQVKIQRKNLFLYSWSSLWMIHLYLQQINIKILCTCIYVYLSIKCLLEYKET
jgi:hypothetical protein